MQTLLGECGNNVKSNSIRNENKYKVLQFSNEEKNKGFISPLERATTRAGKAVKYVLKSWGTSFNTL
jgi:hypothetical protein